MKTNKQIIIEKVLSEGYELGIYDKSIDKLNKTNLKKILDNIRYVTDTKICINRKYFICEISECDNEIDFNIIPLYKYEDMYGKWED